MEAYNATKDFHDEKIVYARASYLLNKNEVRSNVTFHFPTLDLSFLDMESKEEDEKGGASEPIITVDPPASIDPPSTA